MFLGVQYYRPPFPQRRGWADDLSAIRDAGLGGIQLSAAIVNSTKLTGVPVGNITLDAGQAPYADRINTQNANQTTGDSLMYQPVTGLIHLGLSLIHI